MATEKTNEGKGSSGAQRNCELLIARLSDYLSIRFDLASRINPLLKGIKQDLIYHELANVRRALLGEKIYGPIRLHVADVLLSDDEKRRRALMSSNDQTSIQVEIVSHCQDEKVESTRGQIKIHDLKTFYASINPALSGLIDLIETWMWWDIFDAAELVRFEQKLGLISLARQGRMTEDLRKRYQLLIHPPSAEDEGPAANVTHEEIIHYEVRQLQHIREQWANRRQGERGYMYVLKRDELADGLQKDLIHELLAKVHEFDAIEQKEEIDEDLRVKHAADLRTAPEKITRQALLDFLQGQLLEIERSMIRKTDQEVSLGPPYNYKERQMEQMDRWLNDLQQQIRLSSAAAAPPTPLAKDDKIIQNTNSDGAAGSAPTAPAKKP